MGLRIEDPPINAIFCSSAIHVGHDPLLPKNSLTSLAEPRRASFERVGPSPIDIMCWHRERPRAGHSERTVLTSDRRRTSSVKRTTSPRQESKQVVAGHVSRSQTPPDSSVPQNYVGQQCSQECYPTATSHRAC